MNKSEKQRIIKELKETPTPELDLKKEVNNAISYLDFVAELKFLIDKLECDEFIDINILKRVLSNSVTCKIILERIVKIVNKGQ